MVFGAFMLSIVESKYTPCTTPSGLDRDPFAYRTNQSIRNPGTVRYEKNSELTSTAPRWRLSGIYQVVDVSRSRNSHFVLFPVSLDTR
jgi:hypothetical protein